MCQFGGYITAGGSRDPGCWPKSTALGVTREGSCRAQAACMAFLAWRHSVSGRADVGQAGPVRHLACCCFQLFKKKKRRKKAMWNILALGGCGLCVQLLERKPLASVSQLEFWQWPKPEDARVRVVALQNKWKICTNCSGDSWKGTS